MRVQAQVQLQLEIPDHVIKIISLSGGSTEKLVHQSIREALSEHPVLKNLSATIEIKVGEQFFREPEKQKREQTVAEKPASTTAVVTPAQPKTTPPPLPKDLLKKEMEKELEEFCASNKTFCTEENGVLKPDAVKIVAGACLGKLPVFDALRVLNRLPGAHRVELSSIVRSRQDVERMWDSSDKKSLAVLIREAPSQYRAVIINSKGYVRTLGSGHVTALIRALEEKRGENGKTSELINNMISYLRKKSVGIMREPVKNEKRGTGIMIVDEKKIEKQRKELQLQRELEREALG